VDSITHAVLGAAIGEGMLGRRLGNRAMAWGALIGSLPDVDVLVSPFLGNAWDLWWHRGPTHSLLVIALAAWLLAPKLARFWKKEKVSRKLAGWFVFAELAGHVLIDCFSAYGTDVFWPLPVARVGFGNLFIVDPMFTIPILVSLVMLSRLRPKKEQPKRRRLLAWGLGLAAGYVLLGVALKSWVSAGFKEDLARRKVVYQRMMNSPTPFNILLWRAVVDRGDSLWVGYRSVFDGSRSPVRWTIYPKGADAVEGMEKTSAFRAVDRFSNGWWIARRHVKGAWIADLRFGESRIWGKKKGMVDGWNAFAWDILPAESGETLRRCARPEMDAGQMVSRMLKRIFGNKEAWEANPRLAGVTGSLPEFLGVEE
jgi:inner membrane protein